MSKDQILDNLSTHLKEVIANAIDIAKTLEHDFVMPIHLLCAISEQKGCVARDVLQRLEIKKETIEGTLAAISQLESLEKKKKEHTKIGTIPELNGTARQSLEKAMILAYEHGHNYVGTEHLLHGLTNVTDSYISAVFDFHKIKQADIEKQINGIVQSTSKFPSLNDISKAVDDLEQIIDDHASKKIPSPQSMPKKRIRAIDVFTKHLTDKKIQKDIDPIIGREKEIDRLIHILCRRTKNNPVLLGEPGVGKTAIVEGLAKKIIQGEVPPLLQRKKIYSLDMALLISGTIYRGEFEARLKQLIDEVSQTPDAVLFIDELHNIIGAGSNQGTMDAANILKPALARGQLRCIGATTLDEYKKYVTKDPALERRFQSIMVDEPNREDAITMLSGIRKHYDAFHHTSTTKEAIEASVDLSIKYIHDNYLPDKAIDLLDEAGARVRLAQPVSDLYIKEIKLQTQLEETIIKKEEAILAEKFKQAETQKAKEEQLQKKLTALDKKKGQTNLPKGKVTKTDVAAVISERLGINVEVLLQDSTKQLEAMNVLLKKEIFGQEHVIDDITHTLAHAQFKIKKSHKPFASFLFAGPSGVGKTALAKSLATHLYHDKKALIKFDMSEFSEAHSTAKILGSPAGYIGHKERNRFTDALKQRPYSVIVFDEIDKAHGDVIKLLLQILDEGELTDSAGKKIYFDHSIIIMTTNMGEELYASLGIGFGDENTKTVHHKNMQTILNNHLKERFTPALLGRLDGVCLFDELKKDTLEHIVKRHILDLNTVVRKQEGMSIKADKQSIAQLAKDTYDKKLGARNVDSQVSKIVCELLLAEKKKKQSKKQLLLTHTNKAYHLI